MPDISGLVQPKSPVTAAPSVAGGKLTKDDYTLSDTLDKMKPSHMLEDTDVYDRVEWHGDPKCPCGSGLKADECCFKEMRSDRHPLAGIKQYRSKLQNADTGGYATVNIVDIDTEDGEDKREDVCPVCGFEKSACICGKIAPEEAGKTEEAGKGDIWVRK